MRTETINIYKIDEHPDKEKCFEWLRDNAFYLGDIEVEELIITLDKLSEVIGGTVDWGLSHGPDRGEYITFKAYDEELLAELNAEDCPLTGCFWDYEVIEALKAKDMRKVIDTLHRVVENLYSDEGLTDLCEGNEYEFYIGGKRV